MGTSIFLDESGDLGWEFRHGFGKGGSSRFFTLTAIVVQDEQVPLVERIALKTELAALNARTRLVTTPWESQTCRALQMAAYLCSIVWSHSEFQTSKAFPILQPVLKYRELFFDR